MRAELVPLVGLVMTAVGGGVCFAAFKKLPEAIEERKDKAIHAEAMKERFYCTKWGPNVSWWGPNWWGPNYKYTSISKPYVHFDFSYMPDDVTYDDIA
jgi:hypothetical protein